MTLLKKISDDNTQMVIRLLWKLPMKRIARGTTENMHSNSQLSLSSCSFLLLEKTKHTTPIRVVQTKTKPNYFTRAPSSQGQQYLFKQQYQLLTVNFSFSAVHYWTKIPFHQANRNRELLCAISLMFVNITQELKAGCQSQSISRNLN